VYLIGVHCDLDEIDRRESDCGDRHIGERRTHVTVDGIHSFGHPYDLELDTTTGVTDDLVKSTIEAWQSSRKIIGFRTAASDSRTITVAARHRTQHGSCQASLRVSR
jgi:hypothetical protein